MMTPGHRRAPLKEHIARALTASTLCGLIALPLLTSAAHAAPTLPPPATYRTDRDADGVPDRDDDNDGYDADGDGRDRDQYDNGGNDARNNDARDNDDQDNADRDDNAQGDDRDYDTRNDNNRADNNRDNADRDYPNRDDDNAADQDDGDNANANRVILTGRVVRDTDGNTFDVRDNDDNRVYSVIVVRGAEPGRLRAGDQVEVRGLLTDGNLLRARSVTLLDNDDAPTHRTLVGTVTQSLANGRLEIRTDAGRVYSVRARFAQPTRVSRGDRVSLTGYFQTGNTTTANTVFVADNLQFVGVANPPAGAYGRNFTGTVLRDYADDSFDLRLTDGTILRVQPADNADLDDYKIGQSVQVHGTYRNGVIVADSLQVVGGNTTNGYVTWEEEVVNFSGNARDRFYVQHNGRTYLVDAHGLALANLHTGDTVRFTGTLSADGRTVRATRVTVTDTDTPDTPPQAVQFRATVNRVISDSTFEVRGDNGALYTVSFAYARNYRANDRIRVRGTYRAGLIYATGIDRLSN